jgi:hypothetical protein
VSALFALTDSAVQAVDTVSSSEEVAETGGLRMVTERAGTRANFQLRGPQGSSEKINVRNQLSGWST